LFCGRGQCERCSAGQPGRCPHMTCGTRIHKSKSTNNTYHGESTLEANSMPRIALAFVLSISLIATGCGRPVGQRRTSRFTRTDADGLEHCGTRGNVAIGKAAESSRGAGDPEHRIGTVRIPVRIALKVCDRVEAGRLDTRSMASWFRTSSLPPGLSPHQPIESIANRESGNRSSLTREDTLRCSMPAASGSRSRPR
jgi:hypothetical protein